MSLKEIADMEEVESDNDKFWRKTFGRLTIKITWWGLEMDFPGIYCDGWEGEKNHYFYIDFFPVEIEFFWVKNKSQK